MKLKFSWREFVAGCFALSFVLSGCALKQGDESIRHMTREEAQQKIVIGKTTKEMVREQFGKPTSTVADHDGKDEWRYVYKERQYDTMDFVMAVTGFGKAPKATGKVLKVNFNAKGVVTNFAIEDVTEQDEAHWGM